MAWKRNEINGEANFDIDDDRSKRQINLFGEKSLTKIEEFERNVKANVLNGQIKDNYELLAYSYNQGHIGNHASTVLKIMKKEGLVYFDGTSPLVTYENVYKKKKKIIFKI